MLKFCLFAHHTFNVQRHYLNEETADVFFLCGNNEMEERIPAHKILLAASTDVFDTMFYGPLREGDEIKIDDATPDGFRQFLRYFYFNGMELSLEFIDEVMYLAKKYLVDSYFAECSQFLSLQTEAKGILIAYKQSIRFGLSKLKTEMENSIEDYSNRIFHSEYFAAIDRDFLKQIIEIPRFRIANSELIFDACIWWAQAACKRANTDILVMQNLRDQLGDCFQRIEFSAMKRNKIAECVEKFGDLFTAQELQQFVFMVLAKSPSNTKASYGSHAEYEISKQTDLMVELTKGSQEKLQFIPKKRSLLNAFSLSQCTKFSDEDVYLASVFKISTDKNQKLLLLTDFFPFGDNSDFREGIILEADSIYSIEILFLGKASFFGREIEHSEVIEILPETNTKLIASLDLYMD
ncbi:BTB/POZ domain-containing protein 6-A-like [Bradysia coprophila]|uniref:BTB/POZ domain-containing protein 6-A-like n=1 Tax=Bradysia coprophila TaxID=38358 RepID=UPI00187DC581|nr:BTB/POZ domain-containing protein 6-A-like [Bradysia coprophila]